VGIVLLDVFNLLESSGFFLRTTSFNIQNFYMALLCFECSVRISEERETFAPYIVNGLVLITVVESVYSVVRTDSLYKAGYF